MTEPAFVIAASVQACATIILVGVTIYYAIHTGKMSRQMREQMYNALRPEIALEYQMVHISPLPYEPMNVGAGAAIDVITFITIGTDRKYFTFYGTITPNEHLTEEASSRRQISIWASPGWHTQELKGKYTVAAVYSDIFGRHFKSSIEATAYKGTYLPEIGQLDSCEISKEEWQKTYREAQEERKKNSS